MNLNDLPTFTPSLKSVTTSASSGSQVQNLDERVTMLTRFFNHQDNQRLYPVGKLLANPIDGDITFAHVLLSENGRPSGRIIHQVEVDGVMYPVDAQPIALATLSQWGCIACHDAHGVQAGSDRLGGLQSNNWYYIPTTRRLVTISRTCWNYYILGRPVKKGKQVPSAVLALAKLVNVDVRFAVPNRAEMTKYRVKVDAKVVA